MIARDKPRLPFSLNFSTFPLLPLALRGQPGQLSRVHISSWKGFFGCVCASCALSLARHPSSSRSPCYPCTHGTCQEPGTAQPVLLVAMPHVHTVLQPQQMVTNQPRRLFVPPQLVTQAGEIGAVTPTPRAPLLSAALPDAAIPFPSHKKACEECKEN